MFEWQRFLRLARAQWAESGRGYLWFLAIGIIVHACLWLAMTQAGMQAEVFDTDLQAIVYACGLVISGALFAGRYFEALGARESALSLLMRPASGFEKFLLAFLVVGVCYPIAYTLAFQVCNLPAAMLAESANAARLQPIPGISYGFVHKTSADFSPYLPFIDRERAGGECGLFLSVLALQALMVCSSLYFKRLAMLKGFMLAFVLLLLLLLLAAISDGNPDRLFALWSQPRWIEVTAGLRIWLWAVWLGVPALLWASAAFLVRERELQ